MSAGLRSAPVTSSAGLKLARICCVLGKHHKSGGNLEHRVAAGMEAERTDEMMSSREPSQHGERVVHTVGTEEDLRQQHGREGEQARPGRA